MAVVALTKALLKLLPHPNTTQHRQKALLLSSMFIESRVLAMGANRHNRNRSTISEMNAAHTRISLRPYQTLVSIVSLINQEVDCARGLRGMPLKFCHRMFVH